MGAMVFPIILLVIMIIFAGVFFYINKKQERVNGTDSKNNKTLNSKSSTAKKTDNNAKKEDVFSFMEFDQILDDMIVQQNGLKYTMVLKCKGINYDLMSEIEQMSVEEGFITFLNTLRFPIQLYVQAQNIDLKKTVSKYNERATVIREQYENAENQYNFLVNDLEATDEEVNKANIEKKSIQNVYEYANDIIKYVERLSYNKNLLQRNFYVIVSYFSSEITGVANFKKNEIIDICYNELYTRALSIMSGLSSCSVSSDIMRSNDLAELLYTSYNRDDKNVMNIQQSIESGYYRLYSTSYDAIQKKNEFIENEMAKEAEIKAYTAIVKAIEENKYVTPEQEQDEINKEVAKLSIDIIKNEKIEPELKEKAKKEITEEYKKNKQELMEKSKATILKNLEKSKLELDKLNKE